MIDDPDIFRASKVVIERHGDDALIPAAQRADEVADDGDLGGAGAQRIYQDSGDLLQHLDEVGVRQPA